MKKNLLIFGLVSLFLIFPNISSKAMSSWDIQSRRECERIELANARSDGLLDKIQCYDSYDEAKSVMNNTNNDNLVIIENGMIIDAKYAVIDYDVSYTNISDGYLKLHVSSNSNNTNGYYVRSSQPDDAVVLDYDYNTKRIKVKVSGMIGWIDKYYGSSIEYDVVPLAWVKTPQHYVVSDNNIKHVFPGNVFGTKDNYSLVIDLKPTMLNNGTYYSYDGHYFYTDMKTLINDYKNNTYGNSVNPNNPYYNYYQYLSFRTKTIYNADNLNQFLSHRISNSSSKLLNTGSYFIWAQENYGINAALMLAIGINESGWGNSNIAQTKNNLFGLNAIDATPGEAANYFGSVEDCIKTYGYAWLSYGYVQPGDWRFKGANLGNKAQGLNLKYASDPFWAEKAAAFYYQLDQFFDFQERKQNTYTIAVLNDNYNNGVYARKTPNGEVVNSSFYKYQIKDSAVVVLEEVTASDGKVWYKIQSDPVLSDNFEYIGDSKSNPRINYNWNTFVYVSSDNFRKVTDPVTNYNTTALDSNNDITASRDENQARTVLISNVVNNSSYSYQNGVIAGVKIGNTVEKIVSNLTSNGATNVTITDANGNYKSGNIATGDKVTIETMSGSETLVVVVPGDLTGDGQINSADLLRVRQHLLGNSLTGVYAQAAYMGYSQINSANLLKIRQYLLGQTDIN